MGTSAPEAAVSIAAASKGNADISIGNVLGSNIMNVLVILGLASVITVIAVAKSTVRVEIPFTIAITAIFFLLGKDGIMSRMDGIILWALFLIYLGYLFYMAKKYPEDEPETQQIPIWKAFLLLLVGLLMIMLGSNLAVDAASTLARIFGVSERVIALTIVALGTSLPELFTSVTAARKGNADIAIGNIVGSNIFNLLFVIGTSSIIIPINYAKDFYFDSYAAIATIILLLVCVLPKKHLSRISGAIFLLCYAGYFVALL